MNKLARSPLHTRYGSGQSMDSEYVPYVYVPLRVLPIGENVRVPRRQSVNQSMREFPSDNKKNKYVVRLLLSSSG